MMLRIYFLWVNEIAFDWRNMYNEVLNDLHVPPKIFSGNKIEKNKMGGHVACVGDWRVLYRVCW